MNHTLSSSSLFLILHAFLLMAPKLRNREPVVLDELNSNTHGDMGSRGGRGHRRGRGRGSRGGRGAQRREVCEGSSSSSSHVAAHEGVLNYDFLMKFTKPRRW